jgi:hypothetical protein
LRTLGEYVQDQRGAIENAAVAKFLNISFLHSTERMADQNQAGAFFFHEFGKIFNLATADEIARIGPVTGRVQDRGDFHAGGQSQLLEFIQSIRSSRLECGM